MLRSAICPAIILCLMSVTAYPQVVTGSLEGRVLDAEGKAIQDANVSVEGDCIQGVRGTVTDERGNFRVLALPVGLVAVKFGHIAYHDVAYRTVVINLGKTTTLGEIQLTSKTLHLPGVVVAASKPAMDLNTTALATNISSREFESLPTGRDFLTITQLVPQANQSFLGDDVNISGATGQENAYYVDGMNTTDMYRAIGGTRLPYNFIKEIEVRSGGYEAEFGRATGGIVNVVTHSGSNRFEARAFGFFTGNRLAEDSRRGFVDMNTGDFAHYDAGLSLGGPIVRDRLWFFTAYDIGVEEEEVTFAGLGVKTDRTKINTFALKMTWQPSQRTNIILSIIGDPRTRDRIGSNSVFAFNASSLANPEPFLGVLDEGGINFSLRGSHVVSSHLLVEAAAARGNSIQRAKAATQVGRIQPLFIDNTTGIWSGGYGEESEREGTRNAASLVGTYFLKDHIFKAGMQFEDNLFDEYWVNENNLDPRLGGTIIKRAENNFGSPRWLVDFGIRNRVVSAFGQGSIAVRPWLRMNLGLRWEAQYVKGLDSGFSLSIADEYQPRIGFVLQMDKQASQKITGAFCRFYEQIPTRGLYAVGGLSQDGTFFDHNPLVDPSGGVSFPIARPGMETFEPDLSGEHHDEFSLGYERVICGHNKFAIKGVRRLLREVIQTIDNPETGLPQNILGNPGQGIAAFMPDPKRNYSALELTWSRFAGQRLNFSLSYVHSRNFGNYTGLFSSDDGINLPNTGAQFSNPEQLVNGTGLLPNDRTHVLKITGVNRYNFGLSVGTYFTWQSGTPLSELGANPASPNFGYSFLRKRGSLGRTPAIWDLNFRFSYQLNHLFKNKFDQRLILDVFHLFSPREAVYIEQQHFFAFDPQTGQQFSENPNYLRTITFQPPLTLRLGLEFGL